ncbi:sensor histidine kinase [bacterium]|nr:sensor histidine kinase [bacterium]
MKKLAFKSFLTCLMVFLAIFSTIAQETNTSPENIFQTFKNEPDSDKKLTLFFNAHNRYQRIPEYDWLDQVNIYLNEAEKQNDSAAIDNYSLIQARTFYDVGNFSRSVVIGKELLKKIDKFNLKKQSTLLDLMDDSYAKLQLYPEQIEIRKEKRRLGITKKVSFYDIYASLGLYNKAMVDYIEQEKQSISETDYYGQALSNNKVGNYLRLQNSTPVALKKYKEALANINIYLTNVTEVKSEAALNKANYLKGIIEGDIGKCHRIMKEWEIAIPYLERSIEAMQTYGSGAFSSDLVENRLELAECHLRLGSEEDYEKASDYLSQGVDPKRIANIITKNGLLSLYYEKVENHDNALLYLRKNIRIRDSIDMANSKMRSQQLKVLVGEEIDNSKTMLEEQREALEQSKDEMNKLGAENEVVLISLIFVLLLFAGLVYAYLRSIKNQRLIAAQKHIIESSLTEKDSLLKEIHHRVKNNLQMVSSLLSLQTKNTRSKAAIAALEEGKSRVKAMALIHQKLYQNEDLSVIEMQGYIESLINSVQSVFKKGGHSINITIDAEGVELDIDRAIPFGLILNELVSNSFKYAFPNDDENGKIYIHIRKVGKEEGFFEYTDNGIGLPEDTEERANSSMGIRLMNRLANQLQTKMNSDKNVDGVRFWFNFK